MSHGDARRQRFWRWRRNALRRPEDVAEAWVVLVLWVAVLLGGSAAGVTTVLTAQQTFARERAERRPVSAVVLADVPAAASESRSRNWRVPAQVRWIAPDGAVRTGRAAVRTGLPAGTEVRLWQDGQGLLRPEPTQRGEGVAQALALGTVSVLAVSGCAAGAGFVVRRRLDRRRLERWDRAWEAMGTRGDRATG
ncbi:hypothetical protein AB0P07_27660 [Streptomyces sp. NPDC085944]|uniref:Rv1733c family protein n=1 Tax=Streptomyces sp. NPDC085944 TaxID=3154962 RepID=UPI00341FD303